jgi:predicted transcriptional regulator
VGEERLRVLAEVNGKSITAEEVAPALVNGLDRAIAVDRYVTRLLASEAALEEYPEEAKAARAATEREVLAQLYLRRKSEELVLAVTQADIDKFYKQQVRDEDYASYKLNYYLTQDDLDAAAMERNIAADDAEAKGKFVPVNREGDGFIPLAATPYGLGALVARAKPGDYLRAVRVRDGFLILHVEQVRAGKKPAQTKELNEQIRNLIAQDLLNKELLERREKAQVKLKL